MIEKLNIKDKNYPTLLKEIYNAPKNLYYIGSLKALNNPCVSIVGTRKASIKGKPEAYNLGYNLAKRGYTIVSGLAEGIDTYAHIGAIMAGGKTVAVLGSGLNTIYPKENTRLARKIIETGGLIISEYEACVRIDRDHFPLRNRIISGLSEKVIVVEAGKTSGALITAKCALEQNRDLFCVIGDISKPDYLGCNLLVQEGAKPLTEISTFLL